MPQEINVVKIQGLGDAQFVNVDTTTTNGIYRARDLGLGSSGLVGLIITPFVLETSTLFGPTTHRKGRLFATFRHPLDRAVSMFKYLQYAHWEPTYSPQFKDWTLEMYATSDQIENNWMTRHLTKTYKADLTIAHLKSAKEVLQTKVLVGLINRLEESMDRFEAYFGWRFTLNPTEQESCREGLFTLGTNTNQNTNHKIQKPKPGSALYDLIMAENKYDMELYQFAVQLFEEQIELLKGAPKEYRLEGSTCSKCEEDYEKG